MYCPSHHRVEVVRQALEELEDLVHVHVAAGHNVPVVAAQKKRPIEVELGRLHYRSQLHAQLLATHVVILKLKDTSFSLISFPFSPELMTEFFGGLVAGLDWSVAEFSSSLDLSMAEFSCSLDWSITEFSTGLDWSITEFSTGLDWSITEFSSGLDWSVAEFSTGLDWSVAEFSTGLDWSITEFSTGLDWSVAEFSTGLDWSITEFSSGLDWSITEFSSGLDWSVAEFFAGLDWSDAEFSSSLDWSITEFSTGLDWSVAEFFAGLDWSITEFSSGLDWSVAEFFADLDWSVAEFSSGLDWSITEFSSGLDWCVAEFFAGLDWSVAETQGLFCKKSVSVETIYYAPYGYRVCRRDKRGYKKGLVRTVIGAVMVPTMPSVLASARQEWDSVATVEPTFKESVDPRRSTPHISVHQTLMYFQGLDLSQEMHHVLLPVRVIRLSTNYTNGLGIGKVEFRGSEPAFASRESGKPYRKNHPPVHPTEIRTSISLPSVVYLNTIGALVNYATEHSTSEAGLRRCELLKHVTSNHASVHPSKDGACKHLPTSVMLHVPVQYKDERGASGAVHLVFVSAGAPESPRTTSGRKRSCIRHRSIVHRKVLLTLSRRTLFSFYESQSSDSRLLHLASMVAEREESEARGLENKHWLHVMWQFVYTIVVVRKAHRRTFDKGKERLRLVGERRSAGMIDHAPVYLGPTYNPSDVR
uniref:Uncharacterized protein n=1 Tax=Timema tahoe TaxID=61484 RepID=A0A7R9P093_9NEOP|nr:unnamed protein product [Timema tahoe]